jgi:hypothetical protein
MIVVLLVIAGFFASWAAVLFRRVLALERKLAASREATRILREREEFLRGVMGRAIRILRKGE